MNSKILLHDGSKIAIIGGGPAGSFFAHFAQKWAWRKGWNISITIFDGKDFLQRGPRGCNLCAGVIANHLRQRMEEEGIILPEQRIINWVDGYTIHLDHHTLALSCSEFDCCPIATVFRGNGPRYSTFPETISFDDFLLSYVQDRGAMVIAQPVWDVGFPEDQSRPLSILFGRKGRPESYEADLVVGAFGVNSHLMKKFEELGFGYRPPRTKRTFQAEMRIGRENIQKYFGNTIHIFMPRSPSFLYASLVPKGDYVTLTLIGKRGVPPEIFSEFTSLREFDDITLSFKPHCTCFPRFPVSPAKKPFSDRLVFIGDSSFCRHYKNGLESAFLTAEFAAETVFCQGIDATSFSQYYYRKAKSLIIQDNRFGRLLFGLNDWISSVPLLSHSHLTLAQKPGCGSSSRKIRWILWNMFTGNVPYRKIFAVILDFQLQYSLILQTARQVLRKIKVWL